MPFTLLSFDDAIDDLSMPPPIMLSSLPLLLFAIFISSSDDAIFSLCCLRCRQPLPLILFSLAFHFRHANAAADAIAAIHAAAISPALIVDAAAFDAAAFLRLMLPPPLYDAIDDDIFVIAILRLFSLFSLRYAITPLLTLLLSDAAFDTYSSLRYVHVDYDALDAMFFFFFFFYA